ncbi:Vacuolar protein sorting-associated protein 54 [Lucilia cuprina]|uniref:Vacuolar protein sorting-associated protein 54 n=1 Tax=Lucilia cuprina TaxID=7375 RepID=A0A0L0C8E9_LUCCU|nr:vacuolar protein sorting-associated protein 54 [Lucilia cuprina]KAI8115059.1 Vacuolar protein sorting-associated protein 54 [Lucilia cuprina]KNC27679.1 Vacuolar protein sorting-associated protein 54 [Lucilia cuprina]
MATEHDMKNLIRRPSTTFVSEGKSNNKDGDLGGQEPTLNNRTGVQVNTKGTRNSWETCYYCTRENFKAVSEFVKHLRERHCTREGGSFVCRYGFNGVCPSLPLDGVSDRDYDAHVAKYHVNQQTREMPPEWSVFSAAQNLPAVLNDPSRGKQSNLFTKKWGVDFVERSHIPVSPRLPEITCDDFEKYISKIGKRYKRHERLNAQQAESLLEESSTILVPKGTVPTSPTHEASLSSIPDIFLKDSLNLQHAPTFAQVFPGLMQNPGGEERRQSGRLLQEQLSHYLDIVEVKIAQQVSQKSAAFFHAMTSQDAIMCEMQEAAKRVQALRTALRTLNETVVVDTFRVLRFAQRRQNFEKVLDKLCLMATVHKTQPMLQLLLGTQDYVAALDLIGTTQEILAQELIGVHCFKHLPMQLTEMEKLIDKMLTTEFERYTTTELNRPLQDVLKETDSVCAEEDKLVCIVMGLLRKKNFSFVEAYKDEAIVTIRTIIKQLVIEFIATSDAEICLTGAGEEAQNLSFSEWISLLAKATVALLMVLQRIQAVTHIMRQTTDAAAGRSFNNGADNQEAAVNLIDSEAFLTSADQSLVHEKLNELLVAVCHYCHERCANLVSQQSLEKFVATAEEIAQLTTLVDDFTEGCQAICGVTNVPLKVALKVQASRFANRFHSERKQKLALLLDTERWRQVDIPNEFQKIIDRIAENKEFLVEDLSNKNTGLTLNGHVTTLHLNNSSTQASPVLLVENKPYTLVGSALLLVQMLCEYCRCAQRLPIVAGYLSRNVVDLLRNFNSRSCQLVIGAGALRVAGLKTITSTNLALVSRALQLILWLLPKIKQHFQQLDASSVTGYDGIEREFQSHVKEIENKIYTIVMERIAMQLEAWDARPPIPSQSFRIISRHLVKLHEAIAPILPEQQIHSMYGIVHRNFKDKLREQLLKLNIINNGGPQHGVVTSELTFYMETLRTLKALPAEELDDSIQESIWIF